MMIVREIAWHVKVEQGFSGLDQSQVNFKRISCRHITKIAVEIEKLGLDFIPGFFYKV